MKLHIQSDKGFTLIENKFIDEYMPSANGEYVKLYLYLLRCAGTGRDISVSSIADFFDHTEKDVQRALLYWEKLHLLRLTYSPDGSISDIMLVPDDDYMNTAGSGPVSGVSSDSEVRRATENSAEDEIRPASSIGSFQVRKAQQDENFRQLIFVGEQYMGRPLTVCEMKDIIWMSEELHFSDDLIEYLMEYCASKTGTGHRYAEKVALAWHRRGIRTVEEAKADSRSHNMNYNDILKELGISGRSVTAVEVEYMDRWSGDFGFSVDIIREACRRTILAIHQPSFEYINSILQSWHDSGVSSKADIARLDEEHSRSSTRNAFFSARKENGRSEDSRNSAVKTRSDRGARSNTFNSIPQHDYDWSDLEARIGSKLRAAAGQKGD